MKSAQRPPYREFNDAGNRDGTAQDEHRCNNDDDWIGKAEKSLINRHNASQQSRCKREECHDVMPQSTPDEKAEHRGDNQESFALIERHWHNFSVKAGPSVIGSRATKRAAPPAPTRLTFIAFQASPSRLQYSPLSPWRPRYRRLRLTRRQPRPRGDASPSAFEHVKSAGSFFQASSR